MCGVRELGMPRQQKFQPRRSWTPSSTSRLLVNPMAAPASCPTARHAPALTQDVGRGTLSATGPMSQRRPRQGRGLIIRCDSLQRMRTSAPPSPRHRRRRHPLQLLHHSQGQFHHHSQGHLCRRHRLHHLRRRGLVVAGEPRVLRSTTVRLRQVGALSHRSNVPLIVVAFGAQPMLRLWLSRSTESFGARRASGPIACSPTMNMRARQ